MNELVLCEIGDSGLEVVPSFSPFCTKIHRALALHDVEFRREHRAFPGKWSDINPTGQVPILLVDGEPVADSTQILKRLELISERTLVPQDPAVAAEAWLWEAFADGVLNGWVVAARWADDRNWNDVREEFFAGFPQTILAAFLRRGVRKTLSARDVTRSGNERCWSDFEEVLDWLELRAPSSGFWVSERPSVADVAIYGQLQSLRLPLTPVQRALVESRRRLTSYLDRVAHAEPVLQKVERYA